jgi:hypothetical protein
MVMLPTMRSPLGVYVQHGDVVSTPARTLPLVRHFGVWDDRAREVIHSALPVVQVSPWKEFANGSVRIERRAPRGREDLVVARARAYLGQKYDLVLFNCEHLANVAATGQKTSPQLQRAVAVGLGLWLFAVSGSPKYDASVDRYRGRDGRFRRD